MLVQRLRVPHPQLHVAAVAADVGLEFPVPWVVEAEDQQKRLTLQNEAPVAALTLDGDWEFRPETENALVIGTWLATQETAGAQFAEYIKEDADTTSWLPMVPGAWSYQLPAEPESEYPIAVWYRISFQVDYLPPKLNIIVDGFAGSDWTLYVNGERATNEPVRSQVDGQMKAVDITPQLRLGENVIALRLAVTNPTDGLLDLLKLTGDFSLISNGDGTYRIQAPRTSLKPQSWIKQGYPYFSGRAIYRKRFNLMHRSPLRCASALTSQRRSKIIRTALMWIRST